MKLTKNEYNNKWQRENPDKVRAKYKRYSISIKGIVNTLKKKDKKKFGYIDKNLNIELIKEVNKRDLFCVYCGRDLSNIKIEYDHLNPFLPMSNINLVRCCKICNRSKSSANVLEWCEFNNFEPKNIVLELLKKQNGIKNERY
jgi:5-methylcytosine-specific restriction endonuclease McrA